MELKDIVIIPTESSGEPGDLNADIFYEGVKCEVKVVYDKIATRVNAYKSLKSDLAECLSYIEEYESQSSAIIKTALFKSLIITYGRCFSDSEHRRVKLEPHHIFKNTKNQNNEVTHNYMIGLRNNHIAHHSDENAETNKMFFVIPPANCPDKKPVVLTTSYKIKTDTISELSIYEIKETVKYLLEHVTNQISRFLEKVRSDRYLLK